jgi:hypothetical protein
VGGVLLGCKRAAHQRGKRAVFGGLFRTARGQSGNSASGRCGLVYRLQEGSFVVAQEGANNGVYRLQEGSQVTAQVGAKDRGL